MQVRLDTSVACAYVILCFAGSSAALASSSHGVRSNAKAKARLSETDGDIRFNFSLTVKSGPIGRRFNMTALVSVLFGSVESNSSSAALALERWHGEDEH